MYENYRRLKAACMHTILSPYLALLADAPAHPKSLLAGSMLQWYVATFFLQLCILEPLACLHLQVQQGSLVTSGPQCGSLAARSLCTG